MRTRILLVLMGILVAVSSGAVYIMPKMPEEPGPTPRLLLIYGGWHESLNITFAHNSPNMDEATGAVWQVDYQAFESIAEVGRELARNQWQGWRGREILGLWELTEANRIPIHQWHTTMTVKKHIEVEERDLVTDHYKIGDQEFSGEAR